MYVKVLLLIVFTSFVISKPASNEPQSIRIYRIEQTIKLKDGKEVKIPIDIVVPEPIHNYSISGIPWHVLNSQRKPNLSNKWSTLKSHCNSFFRKVKSSWHLLTEHFRGHNFETAKKKALNLIDHAEKLYDAIVNEVGNFTNKTEVTYAHFEVYCVEIEKTFLKLESETKKYEKLAKGVLQSLKNDVIEHRYLTTGWILDKTDLKQDWDYFLDRFKNVIAEVEELYDSVKDDFKHLRNETIVTYKGVKTDIEDIKNRTITLINALKDACHAIKEGNKDAYVAYQKTREEVLEVLHNVKEFLGETLINLENFTLSLDIIVEKYIKLQLRKEKN